MKDKESFLHKLEESLDVMDKNIDDLFSRAHDRELEKGALESLREKHSQAKEKAEQLKSASGEEAEQVHAEAHTVWEDLKAAFKTVRSRLGD